MSFRESPWYLVSVLHFVQNCAPIANASYKPDQEDPEDFFLRELINNLLGSSKNVRGRKKDSKPTMNSLVSGRKKMSWTFLMLLSSASHTADTCNLLRDERCSGYDMMQDTSMALSDGCRRRTVVRRTWGTRMDKRHDSAARRSQCDTHFSNRCPSQEST